MPAFVLDAALTLAWCFADEANELVSYAYSSLRNRLSFALVPDLWPFEVANVLAGAERRRRISAGQVADFLEELRALPIHVERREAIWICHDLTLLCRRHPLTAYDAAYLSLAQREQAPLATLDEQLRAAAASAGIPLLQAP
ncbi:MAG: type II toxin-antitoxin system VapC family toxin [Acidobacteriota bacterium]|nr:type II toxin-antitoxin system VapC family toxin [Acidobacteriota bacterium]